MIFSQEKRKEKKTGVYIEQNTMVVSGGGGGDGKKERKVMVQGIKLKNVERKKEKIAFKRDKTGYGSKIYVYVW